MHWAEAGPDQGANLVPAARLRSPTYPTRNPLQLDACRCGLSTTLKVVERVVELATLCAQPFVASAAPALRLRCADEAHACQLAHAAVTSGLSLGHIPCTGGGALTTMGKLGKLGKLGNFPRTAIRDML